MLKVSANSDALGIHSQRCANRTGKFVSESDLAVHPITHCLNPVPPSRRVPEKLRRRVGQQIHFAISAVHEERQNIQGQLIDGNLRRLGTLHVEFWNRIFP
jgi:hypothetical protein